MFQKRMLALMVVGLGLLGVAVALAHDPVVPRWRPEPPPAPFGVSLEAPDGGRLPTVRHRGTTWVLGELGDRYVIRVRNHTGQRVEAVVSVDGRDAVSGRVADYVTQRGYLIEPYASVVIDGFRTSLDEVAAFRFTSPRDSYSARMGSPENVGVVGVAFFPERRRPPPVWRDDDEWRPQRRSSGGRAPSAAPEAGRGRAAPRAEAERESDGRLGTEYGERRLSHVVEVPFQRASRAQPADIVTLRYDDAAGLRRRGVPMFEAPLPTPLPVRPQAFPDRRFAPPPP